MIPTPDDQEWRLHASCKYGRREQHADLIKATFDGRHWATVSEIEWISQWFGGRAETYQLARTICETRCPVFEQCSEYALSGFDASTHSVHGFIAGRSPVDRIPRKRDRYSAEQRERAMLKRHEQAWRGRTEEQWKPTNTPRTVVDSANNH